MIRCLSPPRWQKNSYTVRPAPRGREAVGISLWDQKESAEAYERSTYAEVLKTMGKVIEGTPQVKTYEVSTSTIHKMTARGTA